MKEIELRYVIQHWCDHCNLWEYLEDVKSGNLLDRLQYHRAIIRIKKLNKKVRAIRITREPLDL